MKTRLLLGFLLLVSSPRLGWSQSTLSFPKFFSAAELPYSGFAIVNPGSSNATVTFTLFADDGTVVASGVETYGPGAQLARTGDQIFNNQLGSGGWIQATSSAMGLQGFWLNYDSALTYADGAEAAPLAVAQVIPLIAGSTDLSVANPNTTPTTVTIELRGSDGSELEPSITEHLQPNGVFHADVFTLFGVSDPTITADTCYVRVVSGNTNALAATGLVKNYLVPVEDGVINGVDETSLATQLNIAHVISGRLDGPNYTTVVGVTNLTDTAQTATATLYSCGNPTFGSNLAVPACLASGPVSLALAARGSISDTLQHLFNFPTSSFVNGWIQISGMLPVAAFAAYADLVGGAFTIVPAEATGSTNLVFADIANAPPWNTGIAVLNPSPTSAASVKIYAMNPTGSLIGGATTDPSTAILTIAPGGKVALGLSQLIPEAIVNAGYISIQSTNNVPVVAIELFYNANGTILANVGSASLANGINYALPRPLTISSISPTSVARGAALTLNGSGFSTTPANDIVVFPGANGTVTAAANAVPAPAATSFTVTIPQTAISGPIQIQVNGQAASTQPVVDVLATPSSLVQSSINVAAGQTTSSVDIYVPTISSGALNLTVLGISDPPPPGQVLQIVTGASSLVLPRGSTKILVVAGTGISAAANSTVSISGPSDVTVSAAQGFQTYFMLSDGTPATVVAVSASATAVAGPRDVVVTNSDLQISTITGGIFIQ